MTDSYQRTAEQLLDQLAQLKHQQRALEADIKSIQHQLSVHAAAGDIDHLKTDSDNTYKYNDINFVFSPGRVTYDYSHCPDVVAARDNLKELEDTAKALGTAVQKIGTGFWTVRA